MNKVKNSQIGCTLLVVGWLLSGCSGGLGAAGAQPIFLGYTLTDYYNVLDQNPTQFYARPSSENTSLVRSGRITSPVRVTLESVKPANTTDLGQPGDVYDAYPMLVCNHLPHNSFVTFTYEFLDQSGAVVDSGSQAIYVGDCEPYTVATPPIPVTLSE